MSEPDWPLQIRSMLLAKERLAAVDSLCPSTVPREGAREEQIQRVEERLGRRLPASYRSFLRHANGWDAFFQTIDPGGARYLFSWKRARRGILQDGRQPAVVNDADPSLIRPTAGGNSQSQQH